MGQVPRRHHHLATVVVEMGTSSEQAVEEDGESSGTGGSDRGKKEKLERKIWRVGASGSKGVIWLTTVPSQ